MFPLQCPVPFASIVLLSLLSQNKKISKISLHLIALSLFFFFFCFVLGLLSFTGERLFVIKQDLLLVERSKLYYSLKISNLGYFRLLFSGLE